MTGSDSAGSDGSNSSEDEDEDDADDEEVGIRFNTFCIITG